MDSEWQDVHGLLLWWGRCGHGLRRGSRAQRMHAPRCERASHDAPCSNRMAAACQADAATMDGLEIHRARMEHAGTWSCELNNSCGSARSTTCVVEVLGLGDWLTATAEAVRSTEQLLKSTEDGLHYARAEASCRHTLWGCGTRAPQLVRRGGAGYPHSPCAVRPGQPGAPSCKRPP